MRRRSFATVTALATALSSVSYAAAPPPAPPATPGRAVAPGAPPAPGIPATPGTPAPPGTPAAPTAPPQGGTPFSPPTSAPAVDTSNLEPLKAQVATQPAEVLKQVARLLSLKGDAAAAYDRYTLFMLRGEAALRTKAMPMASEAFASAQKETDDDAKRSIARANEILVKRSRQTGYQPKAGAGAAAAGAGAGNKPPAPMPIIEEGDRKAAFAALLADELTTVAPKVRAAKNATNLAAIAEPARALGDLRAIEVAATGAAEQTRQIGADLGERAHQLISDALKQMSNRTEAIWAQASAPNQYAGGYGAPGLHGLTSVESGDLKNIIANSEKVVPVAKDFATVTANAALQGDSAEADKLLARAKEVLSYNYAGVYGLPPASSNLPPGQRNRTNVGIGTGGGYGR